MLGLLLVATLALLVGLAVGFLGGVKLAQRRAIDYKARWQQANSLLQVWVEGWRSEIEKIEKRSPPSLPPSPDLGWLRPRNRVKLEVNHLKAGGQPRDPLTGLPGRCVLQIEQARQKYWDRHKDSS